MIFIDPGAIIGFLIIFMTAHNCVRVIGSIKGATPTAFNTTLERVALKQASRNPRCKQHSSKPPYTQLSKPPPNAIT